MSAKTWQCLTTMVVTLHQNKDMPVQLLLAYSFNILKSFNVRTVPQHLSTINTSSICKKLGRKYFKAFVMELTYTYFLLSHKNIETHSPSPMLDTVSQEHLHHQERPGVGSVGKERESVCWAPDGRLELWETKKIQWVSRCTLHSFCVSDSALEW